MVIAAMNRTAERVVTAAGLSVLLIAQWMVIFAGTTTLLPLTGVPAPYLSFGKTSMVVFVLVAAMLARLAENGEARELTNELGELRRGCLLVLIGVLIVLGTGIGVAVVEGVVLADQTSLRGVVTHLAPEPGYPRGRVIEKHDPRLESIAARIPRGPIVDRTGQLIAGVDADGNRTYPLGDALGTLLGPPEDVVLRPLWMLERQLGTKVRGYGEHEDGFALWLAREKEAASGCCSWSPSHEEKPRTEPRPRRWPTATRCGCCRWRPPTTRRCCRSCARAAAGVTPRSPSSPRTSSGARPTSRSTPSCRSGPPRS
jgi:hypothetical protein